MTRLLKTTLSLFRLPGSKREAIGSLNKKETRRALGTRVSRIIFFVCKDIAIQVRMAILTI